MAHAHRRTHHPLLALALVAVAAFGLAACGDDDEGSTASTTAETTTTTTVAEGADELTVSDPWVRPVTDLTAMNRTAVYLQITGGAEDDALLSAGVPSDVATTVEVHETVAAEDGEAPMGGGGMETTTTMGGGSMPGGGMMQMRPVERIEVPAGETVALEPGGYHIMLLDLQRELPVGETVEVTLTFEVAGDVVVTAEVREP